MEAVTAIGGALLSSSVEILLNKLASSDLLNFARQESVTGELKKWKTMLHKIHMVLEDAEEQTTNKLVMSWLSDFTDLAYDIEDIVVEFETEALRRKLDNDESHQASSSKIRKLIPASCCACLNPSVIKFNLEIASKMKHISTRLEEITRQKDLLSLREIVGGRSNINRMSERLPTTSLLEAKVFGREKEKQEIVQMLLSGEESNANFSVIPIQGMGGIGKTTLAQLAYNDDQVKNSFDLRLWVCVSDYFDIFQITKTILHPLSCDVHDLNHLQEKLKDKLSMKKFLIVFDDVWTEDYLKWDQLCRPLEAGAPGSKVIVTTRNQGVSSMVGTITSYTLKKIANQECLFLFAQHALGERNFDVHSHLKDIGEKIAERCNGLPLAAKVLGGLLRGKQNRGDWEDVLRSDIWDIPEEMNGISPALRLSFHYLPSHLKRCFAYCAMFPKDYQFDREELILLWMAEGFLQQPEGNKQIKDIGCKYFNDLISLSFFQQSSRDESRFVMHDLIHDLARFVSREICLNYEANSGLKQHQKVRHFAFSQCQYDVIQRFDMCYAMKYLRTFFVSQSPIWGSGSHYYLTNKVICHLLPELKCLRVLSLRGYCIKELPDSISKLKLLHYLDLSSTEIKSLPESVGALYNLQTLILRDCEGLMKLPTSIGSLTNLLHLDIRDTLSLKHIPLGIANLANLVVVVGEYNSLEIRELNKLPHVCGQLAISELHRVEGIRAVKDANLKLQDVDVWTFEWTDSFDDSRDARRDLQFLEALKPHQSLRKLSLKWYGGITFPSWMSDPTLINMVEINLDNCRKITTLPSFGQLPRLKVLCITGMDGVKNVNLDYLGDCSSSNKPFPLLKVLKFRDMSQWKYWSWSNGATEVSIEGFFVLEELEISNCPKLVGKLPRYLPSLIRLHIWYCPHLANSPISLPSLSEIYAPGCNPMVFRSMVDVRSLTYLSLFKISGLSCLDQELIKLLARIEALEIEQCMELKCLWQNGEDAEKLDCLKSLKIWYCPRLVSFAGEETHLYSLKSLKSLEIGDCQALELLPDWVMHDGNNNRYVLEEFEICYCSLIKSFPRGKLPISLRILKISTCVNLEYLPEGMMNDDLGGNNNQSVLEEIEIIFCPMIKSFPRGKLPTTLRKLTILDCEHLESLPEGMMHDDNLGANAPHLEELIIEGCSSVTSFPVGKFPTSLKKLYIRNCTQLEAISESMLQKSTRIQEVEFYHYSNLRSLLLGCFTNLISLKIKDCPALESFPEGGLLITHLTSLEIENCPALVSFPERGLPTPNLKSLSFRSCGNVKSLPNHMKNLTSLTSLDICNCPGITFFPEDGLPPNLHLLSIRWCENLRQPILEWGLHKLTSLESFELKGVSPPDMVSFPDDDCLMLPMSLTHIWIANNNNLESISSKIQNLTSLRELFITSCPQLRSLPKEGMPSSLGHFLICYCPLVKDGCLKDKGEYWPILAGIAKVEVDWRVQ